MSAESPSTAPREQGPSDKAEIVACVLDYFEGWFDGDPTRMKRALHPELTKRALLDDEQSLDETTAQWMIDATGRGGGKARDPGRIEVEVEDVYGSIANATVRSAVYREYVQLAHTQDGWKIVNALWDWT
jgi:Putative lumazine-binding